MSDPARNPALTRPSDLRAPAATDSRGAAAPSAALAPDRPGTGEGRALPPPMKMHLREGSHVKLKDDQAFADGVRIYRGEGGRILYPSSQAAAWVVRFPRVGPKLRVVAESLLEPIEGAGGGH